MNGAILAPASALVIWTLSILLWMLVIYLPAVKTGINVAAAPDGGGQDLQDIIPDKVN